MNERWKNENLLEDVKISTLAHQCYVTSPAKREPKSTTLRGDRASFPDFFFFKFPSSFYSEFFCLVFFTLDFFFQLLKILTLEPVLVLCVIRTIFAIWNRLSRSIWICHTSEITRNIKIHLPLYLLIFHFLDLLVFSY